MGIIEDLQERVAALEAERSERREQDGWLDVAQAAAYLAVSRGAIRYGVRSKTIPVHYSPTGRLFFRRAELDEWMLSGKPRPRRRKGASGDEA